MYDIEISENIYLEDSISNTICTICYICFEPCSKKSNCKCQDLYVHDACLIKYIKFSHKKTCSICLEEYQDIEIKNIVKQKPTRLCYMYIGSYIFCILYLLVGCVLLYISLTLDNDVDITVFICLAATFMTFSVIGIYYNASRHILLLRSRQYLTRQVIDTIITINR